MIFHSCPTLCPRSSLETPPFPLLQSPHPSPWSRLDAHPSPGSRLQAHLSPWSRLDAHPSPRSPLAAPPLVPGLLLNLLLLSPRSSLPICSQGSPSPSVFS